MKTTLVLCSLLALPISTAFAANSPWDGTWKLDPAKSHFTGQTFTYSKGPGNLLHYEDGSTASFDFGLDGKPYKTWANRTTSFTPAGNSAWDTVTRIGDKVIAKGSLHVSADGRTLTMSFKGTRPDGSAFAEEDAFTRVSGTEGLIGTWRTAKASSGGPLTFVISTPAPGVLHYDIPDMKASVEGLADGTDHPIVGPEVPPGMTIGFKLVAPTKVQYTIKINGKPDSYGVQTIAADGATFTDVNWIPGRENEKTTALYVKQ